MRKTEFIDLLKYYFRKEDKGDLKGILEDCEEQFRLGAKEGKSEEEVCCTLGHPKNIYRYYIGKPIVPEDNAHMADPVYRSNAPFPAPDPPDKRSLKQSPYDWDKDPDLQRRRAESQQYYHDATTYEPPYHPQAPQPQPVDRETGRDFDWNAGTNDVPKAAKAVASPFLDIIGTLFGIASGLLYLCVALAILACIGISMLPSYFYTDLLPLPTLSLTTMIFTVLAILFAALTTTYAGEACHDAARSTSTSGQRRRA